MRGNTLLDDIPGPAQCRAVDSVHPALYKLDELPVFVQISSLVQVLRRHPDASG
jgi:hypothetical protein